MADNEYQDLLDEEVDALDPGNDDATMFDEDGTDSDASDTSFFQDDSSTEEDEDETETGESDMDYPIPVEYGIDFETGQLTGGKVSGKDAVAVWAWLALQTERFAFEQFTTNYGSELPSLMGKVETANFFKSDAKRMIEDCLTVNRYINGIEDFQCQRTDKGLVMTFTIDTTLGEVSTVVTV